MDGDIISKTGYEYLLDWSVSGLNAIQENLIEFGICRLRGFLTDENSCQQLLSLLNNDLIENVFWSTPRARVSDKTFTSTEYSSKQEILLHSEMAYHDNYPRLLCFHALRCASSGGQTTVSNLDALSSDISDIVDDIDGRGIKYVRVFRDGIDVPIMQAFQANSMDDISQEVALRNANIEYNLDGSIAITFERSGVVTDECTNGLLWFNQLQLFHPAGLPSEARKSMTALFAANGLPRQAYYGDGSVISDSVVLRIIRAFNRRRECLQWKEGDVLLLDNLRFAHGRLPYAGERKLYVTMAMPESRRVRRKLSFN